MSGTFSIFCARVELFNILHMSGTFQYSAHEWNFFNIVRVMEDFSNVYTMRGCPRNSERDREKLSEKWA